MIEKVETTINENGVLIISGKLATMILSSEKRRGVRGAGSKKRRIQKKVVKRRLMQIFDEYLQERIKECTKANSEQ